MNRFCNIINEFTKKNIYNILLHTKRFVLRNAEIAHIDGNFWSTPTNYLQMVLIHIHFFEKFFNVVYILLNSKSEEFLEKIIAKM